MVLRTYLSRLGLKANSGDTIFSDPAASPPPWAHLGRHAGGNCGPSGSGKTVVQNFLHAEMRKAGAQQVFIDKDRGAEIFVRALLGVYLILNPASPPASRPSRRSPTPRRSFLVARMAIRCCMVSMHILALATILLQAQKTLFKAMLWRT
ncbi:hypothetical protein NKH41_32115 [Mesorhizobium sp. M1169]|uniref:hypothetical protein n=1 Tax=Mesorhizobium sp. M1169 TaxID=2957066 RepID=UPI003336B570